MPNSISRTNMVASALRSIYKGPGADTDTTSVNTPYTCTNVRTGSKLPGWKSRIRKGQSATTTLTGSKQEVTIGAQYCSITYWDGTNKQQVWRYRSGNLLETTPTYADVTPISTLSAENLAKARLVKKARQIQSKLQGMTVLGELGETLRMIKHPASAFRNGLDDFLYTTMKKCKKNGKWIRQGRTRGDRINRIQEMLGGSWMEAVWGWGPLMSDIQAGMTTLAEREVALARELEYVISAERQRTTSITHTPDVLWGFLKYRYQKVLEREAHVIFRGAVKREVTNGIPPWRHSLGFKLDEFIPTVYEVIPYSWLVDYFSNIGDVLSAWAYHRANFGWLQRTYRRTATERYFLQLDAQYAKNQIAGNSGWRWIGSSSSDFPIVKRNCEIARASYTDSVVPDIVFEIPGMGSRKWLNLGAFAIANRNTKQALKSLAG